MTASSAHRTLRKNSVSLYTIFFVKTKDIFDPMNIFNPGKKVRGTLVYAMETHRHEGCTLIMNRPYAYVFPGASDGTLLEVGGKGLSLMRGTKEGLPVPPGFILTVEFFLSGSHN